MILWNHLKSTENFLKGSLESKMLYLRTASTQHRDSGKSSRILQATEEQTSEKSKGNIDHRLWWKDVAAGRIAKDIYDMIIN